MNRFDVKVLRILALSFVLFSCGNYEEFKEDPANLFTRVAPNLAVTFSEVEKQVLTPRCVQCHPGYNDYETVRANLNGIAASVASNRMPQNGPLSERQKGLLLGWIAAGAPQGTVTPIRPNPDDNELRPTYASISRLVLGKKCVVCHNPQGRVPFLDLSTREAIWLQRDSLLNFKKPEESYLLEVIQDPFEPMPPLGSPFEQVTDEEVEVLKEWISKGMP